MVTQFELKDGSIANFTNTKENGFYQSNLSISGYNHTGFGDSRAFKENIEIGAMVDAVNYSISYREGEIVDEFLKVNKLKKLPKSGDLRDLLFSQIRIDSIINKFYEVKHFLRWELKKIKDNQ